MQVSFRIDAASYGSFLNYSEVILRNEDRDASVVVTCDADEVEFKIQRTEAKEFVAHSVQRKRKATQK